MKPKIAINGFGRIGRIALRCVFTGNPERNFGKEALDVAAINDLSTPESLANLLKHDSVYGLFEANVDHDEKHLIINGKKIPVFSERDPEKLPWGSLGVRAVLECTGVFRDKKGASKHLKAGAEKVLISAPAEDPDVTLVFGVNEKSYDPQKHAVISMASCTTGSLAPLCKVLLENFGIEKGLMTTIHSYTADQNLVDGSNKDARRARSAALSMIPTSTGAAKAIGEVIPKLAGKMHGIAVRVPTPTVSLTDLACVIGKKASKEDLNAVLKKASENELKGILQVSEEPLVSIDFRQNPHSSIIDADLTMAEGNLIKIYSWYDNEWGYAMRLSEMALYILR